MFEKVKALEKKYEGIGVNQYGLLLLTPQEGLAIINELEELNLDIGILGLGVWLYEEGRYNEVLGPISFDSMPRDANFVKNSYLEAKKELKAIIKEAIYDRVEITFESERIREKRLKTNSR